MVWYSKQPELEAAVLAARETYATTGLLVITGPSGCGKSHLSQSIHDFCRKSKPFLVQGMASLEAGRFESQLFGHEKGSFSGAVQPFAGLLGGAGTGTLCLEGLEDLNRQNQAKMLRLLQSGVYRGVGSVAERHYRGGLILTSRFGLRDGLSKGLLREDFYFRISGSELALPDLNQRPEDFEDLFAAVCRAVAAETSMQGRAPDAADLDWARSHGAVGNLHGLRNLIQQSMIRGVPLSGVETETSPKAGLALPETGSLKGDLAVLEKQLLVRALDRHPMSRKELAASLGISMRSLMYKLRDFGLND